MADLRPVRLPLPVFKKLRHKVSDEISHEHDGKPYRYPKKRDGRLFTPTGRKLQMSCLRRYRLRAPEHMPQLQRTDMVICPRDFIVFSIQCPGSFSKRHSPRYLLFRPYMAKQGRAFFNSTVLYSKPSFLFFKQFAGGKIFCHARPFPYPEITAEKLSAFRAKTISPSCINMASIVFRQKAAFPADFFLHNIPPPVTKEKPQQAPVWQPDRPPFQD